MRDLFCISTLVLSFIMFIIVVKLMRMSSEYKKDVVPLIVVAIAAMFVYSAFVVCKSYQAALFLNALYFIGTDWLAFYMLRFAISYSGYGVNLRPLFKPFIFLAAIDSMSLVINTFTRHTFDLSTRFNGKEIFWISELYGVHWIHLSLCYVMVLSAMILLAYAGRKASSLYKKKFFIILTAFTIVVTTNFFCYTLATPIDYSVPMYAVLAVFIAYYTIYSFPIKIVAESLGLLSDSISDGIFYFDVDGNCIFANHNGFESFGKLEKETHASADEYYLAQSKSQNFSENDFCEWNEDFIVDGQLKQYKVTYNVLVHKGEKIGSVLRFSDKTDEIDKYLREKYLATHDELTGILNREGYFEEVKKALEQNPNDEWVMISSNIKDFKLINELFGEELGDRVLMREANLLQVRSHPESVYGRISSDKFSLFCKQEYFNERIFTECIETMRAVIEESTFKMFIRTGVYFIKDRTEDPQVMYDKTLLAISNDSDYQNVFRYYDSALLEKTIEEKKIITQFETAIEQNELEVYLQPMTDAGGNAFGAEALVRWHHPEKGLLLPEAFLPILEKSGLITKLDVYVWEEVAKILADWKAKGIEDKHISVNVSAKDFYYTNICEYFTELVKRYGIKPSSLKLEFSESVLMSDFEKSSEIFASLQLNGFEVEIDDFGSGYSSLNMLKDIRANILKIDMVFLQETVNRERSRIILAAIISMANELGLNIITEGVENTEQLSMLQKLGCKYFQGFYFGQGLPVKEFQEKYL